MQGRGGEPLPNSSVEMSRQHAPPAPRSGGAHMEQQGASKVQGLMGETGPEGREGPYKVAQVRACMHACVRVCVCACVRACLCVCMCVRA